MRVMNRIAVIAMAVSTLAGVPVAVAEEGAVIRGKVIFKGDAKQYGRSKIDTSDDPDCKKDRKAIGTFDVILNRKTDPATVRNVLVYVKDGLAEQDFDAPSKPVTLKQFGCEFMPHVLGLMAGQTLKIVNEGETEYLVHLLSKKNEARKVSLPDKGVEEEVVLVAEDVFKIKCDLHPWMICYVRVFTHPFFAVTGMDGRFELMGLPPGKYTVEAWHETFGTVRTTVEVATDETKESDLTYEPGG